MNVMNLINPINLPSPVLFRAIKWSFVKGCTDELSEFLFENQTMAVKVLHVYPNLPGLGYDANFREN